MICQHCGKETTPAFSRSKNRIIEEIKSVVCEVFMVQPDDIYVKIRKRDIVLTRQVIGYFISKKGLASLNDIATCFGGAIKDHSTVINGNHKVNDYLFSDPDFKHKIEYLDTLIDQIIKPKMQAV